MAYPNGAIRISRTKGRKDMKNCVSLSDIIKGEHLLCACICATYIDEPRLNTLLQPTPRKIPIYIVREMDCDPEFDDMKSKCKIKCDNHSNLPKSHFDAITHSLNSRHQKNYGPNWRTFYTHKAAQSSNMLLLVYPTFLRIAITSSLHFDTDQMDNHWYIHDLPPKSDNTPQDSDFRLKLLNHLLYLGTTPTLANAIGGRFDFTTVKVGLFTSIPGRRSGGLLGLKKLVQQASTGLYDRLEEGNVQLEVCASTIGEFPSTWLVRFYECALGKAQSMCQAPSDEIDVPNIRLFWPTKDYVANSPQHASSVANNLSCLAAGPIKNTLHQYQSKDSQELSTQNLILAYNSKDSRQAPYYIYIGSTGLTISAWGTPTFNSWKTLSMNALKTQATCGVFIPGDLIHGLLKEGTESWQEGIVTYNQAAPSYNDGDEAWSGHSNGKKIDKKGEGNTKGPEEAAGSGAHSDSLSSH
ncbi:tyrosyl-DNA phosphodiesterase-domain-containing protein [Nemania sp. FL0031]|nr:tyrosyl-DNA phosphodiesterase-domain-containing protein [Nemania sp. FL0031]